MSLELNLSVKSNIKQTLENVENKMTSNTLATIEEYKFLAGQVWALRAVLSFIEDQLREED